MEIHISAESAESAESGESAESLTLKDALLAAALPRVVPLLLGLGLP